MARRTSALFASIIMIRCSSSCRWRRYDAELLQQAELVPARPVFDPLAALVEPGDDHHADVDSPPSGGNAEQHPVVRAAQRKSPGHAIALRDHFFDRAL